MSIKPVLKVFGLPIMLEDQMIELHANLVAAAVSIKEFGLKDERGLIIVFSADSMKYGLGSEILIEYKDLADHWMRSGKLLVLLAAKLGGVMQRRFPSAFVQSEVTTGDGQHRYHWTSEQGGTREEVDRICVAFQRDLPKLEKEMKQECYCETNAADHKGPCHYCNRVATHIHIIKEGMRILAIMDPVEFQAEADVYVIHAGKSITT